MDQKSCTACAGMGREIVARGHCFPTHMNKDLTMNRSSFLMKLSCAGLILFSSVAYSSVSLADECLYGDCTNGEGVQSRSGAIAAPPSIYVGQFKNGKYNGIGSTYFIGGEMGAFSGLWKDGGLVKGTGIDSNGNVLGDGAKESGQRTASGDAKERESRADERRKEELKLLRENSIRACMMQENACKASCTPLSDFGAWGMRSPREECRRSCGGACE